MATRPINNFLKLFGLQLKKNRAITIERMHYEKIISGGVGIFEVHKKYEGKSLNGELSGLVFSKDRAMQLHALLTSYIGRVLNYSPLYILYKTTNENSRRAYNSVKAEFASSPIYFIEEDRFDEQVRQWLSTQSADRIFFMTDDAIFLDSFDMNDALLFNPLNAMLSLTKGNDLKFCFALNTYQELPLFEDSLVKGNTKFNYWNWGSCPTSPSWNYPLSVDGTFFLRAEMLRMVENTSFKNPNTLEAHLQVFTEFFYLRSGVCYDKVKLINVPCNLVQSDFNNRSTGYFSPGELQLLWNDGKRIDVERFNGLNAFDAEHKKYDFVS